MTQFYSSSRYFKRSKWQFFCYHYSEFENYFLQDFNLRYTVPFSRVRAFVHYNTTSSELNLSRSANYLSQILNSYPRITKSGKRLKLVSSFCGRKLFNIFSLFVYLTRSEKRRIIDIYQTSTAISFSFVDIQTLFGVRSEHFDYHGWNYTTSVNFVFSDTFSKEIFENFFYYALSKV
jgi:hypothetical protein